MLRSSASRLRNLKPGTHGRKVSATSTTTRVSPAEISQQSSSGGLISWLPGNKSKSPPPLDYPLPGVKPPPTLPDYIEPTKTIFTTVPNGLKVASEASATLMGGAGSFSAGGTGKGMYYRLYLRVLNEYRQVQSFSAFNSMYNDNGRFGNHATAGISTSRERHVEVSSETNIQPMPSPLSQVPALLSGKTEEESSVQRKRTVQAVLKKIKQSPKKVNLVAALVRGMRVEDALLQMQVTVKRAAKTVYKVIHSARANAVHNHGLDGDRLIIAQAFVGKGLFRKTISYHAKGRSGIRVRPQCRLTVIVRELTPEEEAEIAKLRVRKFRKLSKREHRLVPHKLVETQWRWHRKPKDQVASGSTMA